MPVPVEPLMTLLLTVDEALSTWMPIEPVLPTVFESNRPFVTAVA